MTKPGLVKVQAYALLTLTWNLTCKQNKLYQTYEKVSNPPLIVCKLALHRQREPAITSCPYLLLAEMAAAEGFKVPVHKRQ